MPRHRLWSFVLAEFPHSEQRRCATCGRIWTLEQLAVALEKAEVVVTTQPRTLVCAKHKDQSHE